MMRHLLITGTLIVFSGLIAAPSAAQPTIAWHPISSTGPFTMDGHTIAIPEGGPGIEVMLEIMVSGWGDAPGNPQVGAYQATLDGVSSLSSGSGADLMIKGFPDSPGDGIYYDETRPDRLCPYCLFGGCTDPWAFEWGCVIEGGGVIDEGGLYYGGTLILEIPAGADGTYAIEFIPADTKTFLRDEFGSSIYPLLRIPATILVLNDCNSNGVSDLEDLAEGTSQDCNDNLIPDECDIADGIVPDVNGNGIPDWCEAAVLYVDVDAAGLDNGTSWTDAFVDLQDALEIAAHPSYPITDIWMAAGTYSPGATPEDSFQLINGVGIYGGFVGTETERDQRDPEAHVTTLSGDLIEGNSYHVVTTSGTDSTAVLDGCTITYGDCLNDEENPYGGGVYNADGSPTLANCIITGNGAVWGGGMCSEGGSPTLVDCTFRNNRALVNGGGMHNSNSSPTLVNCTFIGHELMLEDGCGGGMYNHDSALTLVNCMFSGNRAGLFGGLGGGIYHSGSFPTTLVNCTFSGNAAYPWLLNNGGGAIHTTGLISLKNCILWANIGGEGVEAQVFPPTVFVEYSCIQDWPTPGVNGNIDADPLFVDPDGPDDTVGTTDDDLHLSAGSPCIDAGDNTAVPPGITTDLDGNPRFANDPDTPDTGNGVPPIVDLGAYEVEGVDCNGNGVPDDEDIAQGTSQDCNDNDIPDECEDDCNDNGLADECDIAEGTSQDINGNGIPDECEARMNRYIWFASQNAESVAFRVEMTASAYFPDSLGVLGWVGVPDTNHVSRLVAAPFFSDSWPALVNVADCEIVPVADYEVRPTPDGISFGDPIITATIEEPSPKKWADVVGSFNGVTWTGPDGVVNMDDIMAGVQTFQQLAGAPHWTWIDLDGEVPNAVINFTDIQRLVQGFKGEPYPFSDPANCP